MATTLHAVINRPGEYEGFSANYSGAGFSDMRFKFRGMSPDEFKQWVQQAKANGQELNRGSYQQLEKPSEREPVRRFGSVEPNLFDAIVNRCVDQTMMCHRETMMRDMHRAEAAARGGRSTLAAAGIGSPLALHGPADALICTAQDPSPGTFLLPATDRN
jgi:cytochrome o ubiquinol oxidase subunit 2